MGDGEERDPSEPSCESRALEVSLEVSTAYSEYIISENLRTVQFSYKSPKISKCTVNLKLQNFSSRFLLFTALIVMSNS